MRTPPVLRTTLAVLASATLVVVLAGCGSSDSASPPSGGSSSEGSAADTSTGSGGSGTGSTEDPVSGDWRSIEITDVDGETFTVDALAGTPVFVENFATWCSNCKEQLGKTQEAAADVGDGAVFLALSVETDLDPSDVADYAKDNGFDDIRFAVMTPEMLKAMKDAFGTTALNPPSTPKVTVAADGTVGELVTGFEDPEEIVAALGQP